MIFILYFFFLNATICLEICSGRYEIFHLIGTIGRPCFSSSDVFLFCLTAFLSISLLASVFSASLLLFFLASFMRESLSWAWTHFLAFMEWANNIDSRPAAWSYVPVQSSSCSLRVFYGTFVVENDTH